MSAPPHVDPNVLCEEARAQISAGHLDDAVTTARRAIAAGPGVAEGHVLLGIALCRKGDLEGGSASLRSALEIAPRARTARLNLALALEQDGQLAAAVDLWRGLAGDDPSDRQAGAGLNGPSCHLCWATSPLTAWEAGAPWERP